MTANLVTKKIYDLYHRFGAGVFSVLIFAIFVAACSVYLDPDFGWHLKAGDYIRAHGIPSHDIFTYTARNFPWIDHEWLNDVFVSWLYGLMGYQGLAVFFGLVWGSAVILAGRRLNWALLFVAATAVLPYSGIRPIAWTVLLLAVLERLIEARDRIVLAAVPLLFYSGQTCMEAFWSD